jgi:DNA-binding NarL/FixJ family response regulator
MGAARGSEAESVNQMPVVPKKIVVVEDDPLTCEHLAQSIRSSPHFELVAQAQTLSDARRVMQTAPVIDVLLTDLQLPDGHGIELIREVRKARPDVHILVISVFGDERSVLASIQAGASGYLLKGCTSKELEQALLDLLDGGSPLTPSVARSVLKLVQNELPRVPERRQTRDDLPKLTPREVEVLELLAKGFSPAEISEFLEVSSHTVIAHTRNIHRKLEVSTRAAAIFEAVSLGIIKL